MVISPSYQIPELLTLKSAILTRPQYRTAAEVIGLNEIDFRRIGDGTTGSITKDVQRVFQDAIHGRNKRYEHWLTYVN